MNITVVMCVYNGEAYLTEAIESVLNQSHTDFSFVIVNDGSTDGSANIIDQYAQQDKRITSLHKTNSGLTKSLNFAIGKSTADYIARIDADDIWDKNKLKKQLALLNTQAELALIGCAYKEINEQGDIIGNGSEPLNENTATIRQALIQYNPFFHSSVMFKKSAWQLFNGYNEQFTCAQDYELWVKICMQFECANLPEVLAYRRLSNNNISATKQRAQRWFALRAKLLALRLLKLPFGQYKFILNDLAIILLPRTIINLLKRYKIHG